MDRIAPTSRWRRAFATPLATIALTVALFSAIAGLGGLMIWQSYRAAVTAAEARTKSSAHVVAAHIEWMIEAGDQALSRIDSALGPGPIRSTADTIADITQAVGNLPSGFQYSVYDDSGRLRLSSVPQALGIEVSDRAYFQELRDGAQVVISPQLEERLSGQQVFVIARRIERNGQFQGAASIAIPTVAMNEFWRSMDLGPHSTVSVVRSDGWVVARHPQLEASIDLSGTQLFEHLSEADSGNYYSKASPADGLARIIGYWRVDGWPLVATAGIERGEALHLFWSSLRSGLAVGLPVLGLLALASIWIARLLKADAARRQALEEALERNQVLFREIHHRVKNNLQAVSSLVRLQPLPKPAQEDLMRRIAAMIAVHEQIYGSDQFDRVEVAPYAERLVREIAAGYDSDVEIETRFAPLTVARDQALPIGLIINEVVSNAFKHAFAARGGGRLEVALTDEGDGQARLRIADDGPGYDGTGAGRSMGSRLIAGFVAQLGGTLDIDAKDGTAVSISFPAR